MKYSELYRKLKPYIVADMRAIGTAGGVNTGGGGGGGLTSHELADTTGLGTYHTVSGLTVGQVLIATGATSAAFGSIDHDDLATVTPDQHHAQTHGILSGDHTGTGSTLDLIGFSATNTLGKLTPSSNPGAAAAILASTSGGGLTLVTMDAGTFTATTKVRTPTIDTASGALALSPASGTVNVTSTLAAANLTASADLTTSRVAGHLIPKLTDTYDLGSSTLLWRKGWLSELDTILFAENTITLLGGWFYVTPDAGTVAADVTAGATTIDFGKAMTVGAFVVLRASLAVEYVQVGSLVSGTTYNVTRDLDGSGANAWVTGAPFAVLGTSGQGRIELNAYDTPRIQVLIQGAAYNAQTEIIRLGDLDGNWGHAAPAMGLAVGEYAAGKANLTYDPTNGLRLRVHSSDRIVLDNAGNSYFAGVMTIGTSGEIRQGTGTLGSNFTGLRLWNDTSVGRIGGYNSNTLQWYGSTDGRLYGGSGKTWIDANGVSVEVNAANAFNSTYAVNWYTAVGGTRKAGIGAYTVSGATVLGVEVNSHQLTFDNNGRLNLLHSGGNVSLSSLANSYTNVVNNLGVGLAYDATPAARLHVYGASATIRLASVGASENITLGFYDSDSTLRGALLYAGVNASPNKYFGLSNPAAEQLRMLSDLHTWFNYGTTERMRLDSNGLGIGGTSGTYERLRIQGGSASTDKIVLKMYSTNAYGPLISIQSAVRDWELRSSYTNDSTTGAFEIINRTDSKVAVTVAATATLRLGSTDNNKAAHVTPFQSVNLANGAEATFAAYPGGLVCVIDVTGSTVGLFLVRGTGAATPVLVSETPASNYSNADTSGRVCLYWNGTTYAVKNRTGDTRDFSIIHLGASNYA